MTQQIFYWILRTSEVVILAVLRYQLNFPIDAAGILDYLRWKPSRYPIGTSQATSI